jgi:hypothetical protein
MFFQIQKPEENIAAFAYLENLSLSREGAELLVAQGVARVLGELFSTRPDLLRPCVALFGNLSMYPALCQSVVAAVPNIPSVLVAALGNTDLDTADYATRSISHMTNIPELVPKVVAAGFFEQATTLMSRVADASGMDEMSRAIINVFFNFAEPAEKIYVNLVALASFISFALQKRSVFTTTTAEHVAYVLARMSTFEAARPALCSRDSVSLMTFLLTKPLKIPYMVVDIVRRVTETQQMDPYFLVKIVNRLPGANGESLSDILHVILQSNNLPILIGVSSIIPRVLVSKLAGAGNSRGVLIAVIARVCAEGGLYRDNMISGGILREVVTVLADTDTDLDAVYQGLSLIDMLFPQPHVLEEPARLQLWLKMLERLVKINNADVAEYVFQRLERVAKKDCASVMKVEGLVQRGFDCVFHEQSFGVRESAAAFVQTVLGGQALPPVVDDVSVMRDDFAAMGQHCPHAVAPGVIHAAIANRRVYLYVAIVQTRAPNLYASLQTNPVLTGSAKCWEQLIDQIYTGAHEDEEVRDAIDDDLWGEIVQVSSKYEIKEFVPFGQDMFRLLTSNTGDMGRLGNYRYQVHSFIVRARCQNIEDPVWAKLDPPVVHVFFCYVYCGPSALFYTLLKALPTTSVASLLVLAQQTDMDGLEHICEGVMIRSVGLDNCKEILQGANSEWVKRYCLYVMAQNKLT